MTRHLFLAAALLTLAPTALTAQIEPIGPTLLVDLNVQASGEPNSSFPGAIASNGTLGWFAARMDTTGSELWCSDGTVAGTRFLGDKWPGPGSGADSTTQGLVLPNGKLLYIGSNATRGDELYVSDGTVAGTSLLVDIQPGPGSSLQRLEEGSAAIVGDRMFFVADDGVHGFELWSSDGTAAGTQLELDFVPGPESGLNLNSLFAAGDQIFLTHFVPATQGSELGALELWALQSGVPVLLLTFDFTGFSLGATSALGQRLVFYKGSSDPSQTGWWISDGTLAGTVKFLESSSASWSVAVGNKIFMALRPQANQPLELWVGDGTPGGSSQVNDWPVSFETLSSEAVGVAFGSGLVYAAEVPGKGVEPVFTQGTAASTQLLADLAPGADNSSPTGMTVHDGVAYFLAMTPSTGRELWSLASPTQAPVLVEDLVPGSASNWSLSTTWLSTSAGLLFRFYSESAGYELYRALPDSAGLLVDINAGEPTTSSEPQYFARVGADVFFTADDGVHGEELWISDGSAAGTRLVADIRSGELSSSPLWLTAFGPRIYFAASVDAVGGEERELWTSDGTEAGTYRLLDLNPGPDGSDPIRLTVFADRLYFVAGVAGSGRELWSTDGTAAGTELLLDIHSSTVVDTVAGSDPITPHNLTVFGETLLFAAEDDDHGVELWGSDGTSAGTLRITDANPGPADFWPRHLSLFGDVILFSGFNTEFGAEPWVTDGTSAGTQLLADLNPGDDSSNPEYFAATAGGMTFIAEDGVGGDELWRSFGVPGDPLQFPDVGPGAIESGFGFAVSNGNVSYRFRSLPDFSSELWFSDGSLSGTYAIGPSAAGTPFFAPNYMTFAGDDDSIVFSANDAGNGSELWRSDGTSAGTYRIGDSAPGALYAEPRTGVQLGDRYLFTADDGSTGRELHSVPFEATGGWVTEVLGTPCVGANGAPAIGVDGEPRAGSLATVTLDNVVAVAPALLFFDTSLASLGIPGACNVLLPAPNLLASALADGAGEAAFPFAIPPTTGLVGVAIYLQALAVESGGPLLGLGSTSAALEIVVGP